jgi:UDP-N-acetylmuramate dehydrogenase
MFAPLAGWLRQQHIPFSENAAIAPHLNFKIGGTVSLLVLPHSAAQLVAVLRQLAADPRNGDLQGPHRGACKGRLPYLVLGGGSNIVFGDGLTRAVVLLTSAVASGSASEFRILDNGSLQVGSGVRNQPFLSWCAAKGAGGLEFLSGIPGTLGGAAAVNAGAFGRSLDGVLLGADIIDGQGRERAVDAADFEFRYRESRFKFGSETLLALRLRSSPDDEAAIAKRVRENLEYRRKHHPSYRMASAGCFFKNPLRQGVKTSAGKIIEECGLKKAAAGGLAVAEEHGNFLLNRGQGTFSDLRRLEETIRETVAARAGIVLEREVIYVSPEGEKY